MPRLESQMRNTFFNHLPKEIKSFNHYKINVEILFNCTSITCLTFTLCCQKYSHQWKITLENLIMKGSLLNLKITDGLFTKDLSTWDILWIYRKGFKNFICNHHKTCWKLFTPIFCCDVEKNCRRKMRFHW